MNAEAVVDTSSHQDSRTYRFSVGQFQQLISGGIFPPSDRVELLDGWVVRKVTHNPPHDSSVCRLQWELSRLIGDNWIIRIQSAITLKDSQPEPDLAVALGPLERYDEQHPGPADLGLVVEVADTTLEEDRTLKQRIYARARIPVYWIVNIPDRQLEIYTRARAGKAPRYHSQRILDETDLATLPLGNETIGPFPVSRILPGRSQS